VGAKDVTVTSVRVPNDGGDQGSTAATGTSSPPASVAATAAAGRDGRAALLPRIQDRQQPAFQLRRPRHRDAGQRRGRRRAQAARELQQLFGVVRTARADAQHQVVAGALALDAQPPRGEPRQRMEPVERARHVGERLGQAVEPLDVCQLVGEHRAPALVAPFVAVFREQHGGPEHSQRHRHRARPAAQQPHRPRQTEPARHLVEQRAPGGGVERCAAAGRTAARACCRRLAAAQRATRRQATAIPSRAAQSIGAGAGAGSAAARGACAGGVRFRRSTGVCACGALACTIRGGAAASGGAGNRGTLHAGTSALTSGKLSAPISPSVQTK
jgi:hypothetical protein